MSDPKIGLALSGGGSRAIAFHLGCLRALHDLNLLGKVEVLSTVSGGSVIGGMYASSSESFLEFEERVRRLLSRGLLRPTLRKALTSLEGVRALYCFCLCLLANSIFLAISTLTWGLSLVAPPDRRRHWRVDRISAPLRRFASRTTILRKVLDDDIFEGKRLADLPKTSPLLIVNAADLRTGSAFYFSRQSSGSWRLGELASNETSLAHAVAASAAYPLFLPALDEIMRFKKADGSIRDERVILSDGGVYDNLGLAPLWPDRDPSVSLNVSEIDTIICCRAGYSLRFDPPSQFLLARMSSAFACIHGRAQNSAMKRLYDLNLAGRLKRFLIPYLGQNDDQLMCRPAGLVTLEDVRNYPTDFSAMPDDWIDRLSRRGEELTRALIAEHWPDLADPGDTAISAKDGQVKESPAG